MLATRQLATLVKAGMPLLRGLRTVGDQMDPGPLRDAFRSVARDVESGSKLSEALSHHQRWFQPFYVNMIRAGEVGGLLAEVLMRLAELLERHAYVRDRVRGALMYPVFVMAAAVGILSVLVAFVVPTFMGMFSELGSTLPLATRLLIDTCTALRTWWWVAFLGLAGVGFGLRLCLRTSSGRRCLDHVTLHLPIVGSLVERLVISRFARTFGALLGSGVPILSALDTVRATVTNTIISEALQDVGQRLKVGDSLARPMELSGVFPPIVTRMVALGEETGQLDRMLMQVAQGYEQEVDIQLAGLTQLLEPILILLVGAVVGFIVIAMFLPLLSLTKLLG